MQFGFKFLEKGFELFDDEGNTIKVTLYPFHVDDFPTTWKGRKKYTFKKEISDLFRSDFENGNATYTAFRQVYIFLKNGAYQNAPKKMKAYAEAYCKNYYDSYNKKITRNQAYYIVSHYFKDLYDIASLSEKDYEKIGSVNLEKIKNCDSFTSYIQQATRDLKVKAYQNSGYANIMEFMVYESYNKEPYFKRGITIYNREIAQQKEIQDKIEALLTSIKQNPDSQYLNVSAKREYTLTISIDRVYSRLKLLTKIADDLSKLRNKKVEIDYKDYRSLKEINKAINLLHETIVAEREKQENKTFTELQNKLLKPYETNKYKIVIPQTRNECIAYGELLHNCLGNHEWVNYLRHGERVACVVLEKETEKIVACVDFKVTQRLSLGALVQMLAPYNNYITSDELRQFIFNYEEYIKTN